MDMSIFLFKIIAMITMLTDHMACAFFDKNEIMRSIGRFAFPLYAFMIAEGYYHIKDNPEKVKKHFNRLLLLTIVSEIPYDLMETGKFFDWSSQSVMWTLLIGFLGLMITEQYKKLPAVVAVYYAMAIAITYYIAPNYKMTGVVMIFFFYWFTTNFRDTAAWKRYILLLCFSAVILPIYNWVRWGFPGGAELWDRTLKNWSWLVPYFGIDLLIALYKGENGYKNKILNTCYAWFYPAHLLVLALIEFGIGKWK